MKNYFIAIVLLAALACSNNSSNKSTPDSINAIEDHPLQDSQVSAFPDGYAPPNAEIDTSQRVKDSIKAAQQR